MRERFLFTALPARVILGAGSRDELAGEIDRLGCRRVLLIATPRHAASIDTLAAGIGERIAGRFEQVAMHTPVAVTMLALAQCREIGADGLLVLGGGSAIGLGKALALRTGLPQIVLPTTYSGSEATAILGETTNGRKTTRQSLEVLPEVVIYDAELSLTLPFDVTATSGINAIAHAAETLYAKDTNPVVRLLASEGIAAQAAALRELRSEPKNLGARDRALYGAWLCALCLANTGMALHHKLCHVLGGSFDLPHAPTHCVLLPHALAYNAAAAPQAMAAIAAAIGADDGPAGLFALIGELGGPRALSDLGMPLSGIDEVVAQTLATPYWNPAPLEEARLRRLLGDAHAGRPPQPE